MSSMPSDSDTNTAPAQSPGTKVLKCEVLPNLSVASDIGKAPRSRVYTRDYSKVQPDPKDDNLIGAVLGNPLRW